MAAPADTQGTLDILSVADTVHLGNLVPAENAGSAAAGGAEQASPAGVMALSLADLLPDDHGNVVIVNEAGVSEVSIMSGSSLIGNGVADAHLSAGGMDVAGMAYYNFDSGVTLYLPQDVHLSVLSAA